MTSSKLYKVLSPIPKRDGGTYWMRVGTGFINKRDPTSINFTLDAVPKNLEFTLKELTEDDLRRSADRAPTPPALATAGPASPSLAKFPPSELPF